MKHKEIRKRIKRGIKFLIVHKGTNWYEAIDTNFLHMKHQDSCILGQLHDDQDYNKAIIEYGIGHKISCAMGFTHKTGESHKLLTRLWKEAIQDIKDEKDHVTAKELAEKRHWQSI